MPQLPDPLDYDDHRAFLHDWFESKKRDNPRYSHRLFARRAGQTSPSLLLHVIRGERNLTESTIDAFVKAMALGPDASHDFRDLVLAEIATTDEGRSAAAGRLSARRRFRDARRISGDGFAYLAHWYLPAVRELAAADDFVADPGWIAARLRPRITEAEAASALEVLGALGMLRADADGRLRQADASVVTEPEVTDDAVRAYHLEVIDRAREAVDAFEPEERHLLGVTVLVPEAAIAELKAELNAFQARVLDLADRVTERGDRVMQLNLQLFPLSAGKG